MCMRILANFVKHIPQISTSISARLNSNCKSAPTMRFIQFLRNKNDKQTRLGVVSEDGSSYIEISNKNCIAGNMISFLEQDYPIENIERIICNEKYEPITDSMVLLPPVTNPEKIICIGLNYKDHCVEQNKTPPKEPMFFSKFASTLVGPRGDIINHKITDKMDYEVELAVVIGKEAKHVSCENALDYVFGYTIAQDISARDWQKSRNGGQFLIGKSMDTFCPLGPAIVHKSLIKDPHDLNVFTIVNGVAKQSSNTGQMIFRIDDMIHRISQCITLKPGDVLLTGTPGGVGMYRCPPEYLKPGDVIETQIQGLGTMENKVVADTCN